MVRRFLTGLVVLLPLLFTFCTQAQVGQATQAEAGKTGKIPEGFKFFRLSDSTAFTNTDLEKGRKSLIVFFDATCTHCQDEVRAIGKRYADFRNVHIYLVTMDEKKQATRFMTTFGKDIYGKKLVTVLLDPDKQFLPLFAPEKFPALYVYSKDGQLTWQKNGEQPIEDIVKAVRD